MNQLKRLRREKGLSQAKLAALADVDPSTVNQIERGAREASPATLRKLAEALDVSLAELLEDAAPKAERRSSPEPSFNDVLEGERRIAAIKRFEDKLRHFTNRWREELKNPQKQGRYWCAGVQVTAIGFTQLISKLDLFRRIVEVSQQNPAGLIQEIRKGLNGSAMSDPEFRAAMNLLDAFEDMHQASDEVLEADDTVQGDWIDHEEAEQRRKAFSVIQGEMTA
jgi:transcriptional regulator with XRE-family HTH domain